MMTGAVQKLEGDAGLNEIARATQAFSAELEGAHASRAPMAMVAQRALGGTPEQAERYWAFYSTNHAFAPLGAPVAPLDAASWQAALGDRTREADYRAYFAAQMAQKGVRGALAAYVPALAAGVGASFYYPLMRLAYGLMRNDKGEIAAGLAYWATTYLPMPAATGAAPATDDPARVLAAIEGMAELHDLPPHGLLWEDMQVIGAKPCFAPVIDMLAVGPDTERRMAETLIALFATTQNFSAMHLVMALHWVREILPYTPDRDGLLRAFWQSAASLMPPMNFPALPEKAALDALRAAPVPGWDALKAEAVASQDRHKIGLTLSALEEDALYDEPLYRYAIARFLGLVEEPA